MVETFPIGRRYLCRQLCKKIKKMTKIRTIVLMLALMGIPSAAIADRQGSDKQRLGIVGALDKDGFGNGTCKSKQLFINVEFGNSLPQSGQTE